MDIGNRLRSVREEKKLSQGDIEQRTGLLRCYISRVYHRMAAESGLTNGARSEKMLVSCASYANC